MQIKLAVVMKWKTGCSHQTVFLIAEEDRPARVLGLLVCLASNQTRDEGLGCSELDKMSTCALSLSLSLPVLGL